MNRSQISQANSLLYERDRLVALVGVAESGKGIALAVSGDYQQPEVVAAVLEPLADHFRQKLSAIDEQLTQLGWSGY